MHSRFFHHKLQHRKLLNYHRAQAALTILVCSALTSYLRSVYTYTKSGKLQIYLKKELGKVGSIELRKKKRDFRSCLVPDIVPHTILYTWPYTCKMGGGGKTFML